MTGSTRRFERLVIGLLAALAVLLLCAVIYLVATWPGDGGIFGLGG